MTGAAPALATTMDPDGIRIAVDGVTEPFWAAADRGELSAPQCATGGRFQLPPTAVCPRCRHSTFD